MAPTVTPVGDAATLVQSAGPYTRTGEPQRYWRDVDITDGQLGQHIGTCGITIVATVGMSATRYRFEGNSGADIDHAIQEAEKILKELDDLADPGWINP